MFWGFLEAHNKFWSMEKNNLTTNPLTPPLTAVKDSMVFFEGFPKLNLSPFYPFGRWLWEVSLAYTELQSIVLGKTGLVV